jgi:hypothetical protein
MCEILLRLYGAERWVPERQSAGRTEVRNVLIDPIGPLNEACCYFRDGSVEGKAWTSKCKSQ